MLAWPRVVVDATTSQMWRLESIYRSSIGHLHRMEDGRILKRSSTLVGSGGMGLGEGEGEGEWEGEWGSGKRRSGGHEHLIDRRSIDPCSHDMDSEFVIPTI